VDFFPVHAYGERHQFFELAWNCAVGQSGSIKGPKRPALPPGRSCREFSAFPDCSCYTWSTSYSRKGYSIRRSGIANSALAMDADDGLTGLCPVTWEPPQIDRVISQDKLQDLIMPLVRSEAIASGPMSFARDEPGTGGSESDPPDSTAVDEIGESVHPRRTGADEAEPCTTGLG
jgi:hypothetical protein